MFCSALLQRLLSRAAQIAGRKHFVGGQDCHAEPAGAFTGDFSAEMLRDAGARAVIVGHSERRRFHGETDVIVAAKTKAAWRAGLFAIVCIGETLAERDAGRANAVCELQRSSSLPAGATPENSAIAYEPVWAIGTGRTPTSEEITLMHAHIRAKLGAGIRILYGGSVNPANAREILHLKGGRRSVGWGCEPEGFGLSPDRRCRRCRALGAQCRRFCSVA